MSNKFWGFLTMANAWIAVGLMILLRNEPQGSCWGILAIINILAWMNNREPRP